MFLSITKVSESGLIEKYQEFELEQEAIEHAEQYEGFVVSKPDERLEFCVANKEQKTIVVSADIKEEKISAIIAAHLPAYRDKRVYEGLVINGLNVGTDDLTQARIHGARTKAESDQGIVIDWKAGDTWIELDAPSIITISDAIFAHIQKCFSAHKAIKDQSFNSIEALEDAFDAAYAA